MGVFKTGIVASVTSTTAGTVNIPGTGVVPYTTSPLNSLYPGGPVCGDYVAGTLSAAIPIDVAWITSLVQLNASNLLPLAKVKSSLLNAKCCAVKKGSDIISDEEKECCVEDLQSVEEMFNLADSISCIVPEGEIIGGRQAVYCWQIEVLNAATHNVVVTIGTASYSFTTTSSNNLTTIAAEIAAYINTLYPQNYPYQSASFQSSILVWGSNFDLDNGTAVNATITNGSFSTFPTAKQLDYGTAKVLQPANNISNNQITQILAKLCSLCKN